MALDETLFALAVRTTNKDRNYWATRDGLSSSTVEKIRSADYVFVPFKQEDGFHNAFPDGTADFIRIIRKFAGESAVAIATEENNYTEIAEHAHKIRLPSILVSAFVFPILANFISSEIEKRWSQVLERPLVEISLIVQNEHGNCISLKYEGPTDRLIETLTREVDRCFGAKSEPPKNAHHHRNKQAGKRVSK